jgi:hypothetical protein
MHKMDEIRYNLGKTNKPDNLGICETYLNENISSNENRKLCFERKDRNGSEGEGFINFINEKVP